MGLLPQVKRVSVSLVAHDDAVRLYGENLKAAGVLSGARDVGRSILAL